MTIIKEQAINLIKDLPDNSTWDDIMYNLYVREKIEKALDAAEKGKFISHEDAKKRLLS